MKILVMCDRKGEVTSVLIPNAKLANRINLIPDDRSSSSHRLEVDNKTARQDDLMGKRGEEGRKQAYVRIQDMLQIPPSR